MIATPPLSPLWPRLRWPLVVSVVLGSFFCMGISAGSVRGQSNEARARKIIAAWKKRQDRIRTVQAEVVVDTNVKARSLHVPTPQGPVSYSTSEIETIIFDFPANRQRYTCRGGIYNATLARVVERETITVVQNGQQQTFSNSPVYAELGISAKGQGIIMPVDFRSYLMLTQAGMVPLIWYIRPLGTGLPGLESLALQGFRVVGASSAHGVAVIECSAAHYRFWVDPSMDYVIVRAQTERHEMTIAYTIDEQYGVVPQKWAVVQFQARGTVGTSASCRLRDININKPVDESLFRLTFPEGAMIHEVGGGNRSMVATARGGFRPLAKHEADMAFGTRRTWRWWFLCGNVLIVLLLVGFLLRRKLGYSR